MTDYNNKTVLKLVLKYIQIKLLEAAYGFQHDSREEGKPTLF